MPCRALLLFLLFIVFIVLLGPAWASGAESLPPLPAPKDVMVYSYNFRSSLQWSPVQVDRGLMLYTVHFKTGAVNKWDEINCTRIAQTECRLPWSLKERRWTIVLRVRAELGHRTSEWVETDPFVAERDTTIGPPKVDSVTVSSSSLLISVAPPFEPKAIDFLQYHVSYWENATSATKKETKTTSSRRFKIKDLKQSTLYCFTIQVELMTYSTSETLGLHSVPQCHRTTISEATKAGYITAIFTSVGLLLILIIIGLFFGWKHHKTIKYLCQPPLRIPAHFEEYLRDPSMLHLEMVESYEEDPPDSLSVVYAAERSDAYGSTLDGHACPQGSSSGRDVT